MSTTEAVSSEESSQQLKVVKDATCTFCGCVCDDMELTVEGNRITKAKNACVLGKAWFFNHHIEDRPEALIDGEPALGGGLREPGARAVLVVSGGPVPRTVPQLIGLDLGNAEQVLNDLQLRIARPVGREPSETVTEGTVVDQGLTPGLLIDRGSEVSLTVSSGPDLQEVPDMRGLTVFDAERRLAEVGLRLGEIRGDGLEVQGTEPAAGTFLPPRTSVLLWAPLQD